MDAVTAFIAVYLSAATNTVQDHVGDILGTEIQSQTIEYKDMPIAFQYQIWKIRGKSVCSNFNQSTANYSMCTIKAKSLFSEMCEGLTKSTSLNWRTKKAQNMYCNAAVSYKPFVAQISNATVKTAQRKKEKKCNLLILKTMNNNHPELIEERDLVCKEAQ
ncbi:hypothetical protein [Psychromonas antarctica]|uniref:hypothetical protein n=1 Tax=Psychromonas antarctica TaxID=67573 RepID=UPI001EE92366|nr:hypothetical protein [Psychromonas antarctica]MCG6202416.1 hypothetical protein [Psychromonas antarctica]